jgi:cobalt-zinc-cadmium efflux system membrane fusion protein
MKLPTSAGARVLLAAVLGVVVVAGGIAFVLVQGYLRREQAPAPAAKDSDTPVELVRDAGGKPVEPPTLRLSARTAKALGINQNTIVPAKVPTSLRALPPQMGTLAYDNDRLFAVRSRFPGEVSAIADCPPDQRGSFPLKATEPPVKPKDLPKDKKEQVRQFTVGDRVKEGELLAVVWSKDLGDKKAALIDAIIDLRRDSARLKDLERLYEQGYVSAATYYEAQRTVKKDLSARNAAERTLLMWKLDPKEIAAIKKEGETINEEQRDPELEKEWARVEVRAPTSGIIVEKNTHLGDWVDPSNFGTPMFRIADLSKLQVWLNPAEEYLPVLQAFLKKPSSTPLAWDIMLQADPKAPPLGGVLLRLAPSLDYAQHMPLLVGLVDNPTEKLLVGQFVTATIYVPLPENLVEIPTSALNEEKGQSVVFVQRDPEKHGLDFTMQAVDVVHRFKDFVYVRSSPPGDQGDLAPDALRAEALKPGDRVVTESVVELTKALRDLRAKEKLAKQK